MDLSSQSLSLDLPWQEIAVAIICALLAYIILISTILREDVEAPIDYTVPTPEQCKPGWKGKVLDEPSIKIPGSSAIQCYNPANGQLLGQVNPATPDGIDRAVAKAAQAQREWAKTTFGQRRKVLRTMLKHILDNQETIATVACLDSGKTKVDAMLGEILVTLEKLQWTIKHGEKALRPERRPTNFLLMYKHNEVRWEPLGVLAACVSWNYPFHNALSPIISTLFTGSALLLKSSEQTAFSASYFVSIARHALSACNHSPNLVQSLVCWPQTANHLTSHPGIAHITFIGSRPVAHTVCASAAKALTPVCVELGGKDPAVILDDLSVHELEHRVLPILMKGIFISSGQNCIGIERVIATPSAYTHLSHLLLSRIRTLRIGCPLQESSIDIGACISSTRFPHLESLIRSAVAEGAELLYGGTQYTHPNYPQGHYFTPTLLTNISPTMQIAQEELFAPICLLFRASDTAHAIELANSTSYALGASVFSHHAPSINRCVSEIRCGMISVNDFGSFYATGMPFGGSPAAFTPSLNNSNSKGGGGSGYGRFGGAEGLRTISNLKSISRDAGWAEKLNLGTRIPPLLDYGTGTQPGKVNFLEGM
ncbi:MAG: hypothetical protein Q9218_006459, partial [Villophora microphyllina]